MPEAAKPIPAWPEELDFAEAREILFPASRGDDDFPRRVKSAGKAARSNEAENLQGLDAFIRMLEKTNRQKSGLLSKGDLEKRGISCPYAEARLGVLQAVKYAFRERIRVPHARIDKNATAALKKGSRFGFEQLRRQTEDLRSAAAAARERAKRFEHEAKSYERSRFGEAHEWLSLDGLWRGHSTQFTEIDDAIQILASRFDQLSDFEEQSRRALDGWVENQYDPGARRKKVEAHFFAQYLGFVWFDLTGKPPTKMGGTPFVQFVSAAWNEIAHGLFGDQTDEPSWDSVCRGVIESFEKLRKDSPLICWERSTLGLLPKYRLSGTEPSAPGQEENDEHVIIQNFTPDNDVLSENAPFDVALLFGRISSVQPSNPELEFLRLQELLDAGKLSSADLTAEQVNLFSREKDRVAAVATELPDPRALTPLELRRREIWRDEALAEWLRVASDDHLPSSQTISAGMNIKSALDRWRGPAIRRFLKTLTEDQARLFDVEPRWRAAPDDEILKSIFDDLGITRETREHIENWLRPRTIFGRRN